MKTLPGMHDAFNPQILGAGELPRVLFVDDDEDLLDTVTAQLSSVCQVHTASDGITGLQRLTTDGPFAAIVADMRMPGMNGIELLREAAQASPDTVRIMMTAQGDLQTALGAVNEGHIFRFLVKPYHRDEMARALEIAVGQYRLITAERGLLENTLTGAVQALIDVLALASPLAFGRASRIRSYARQVSAALRLETAWEVELAALFSQIGCITIPPDTIAKGYSGDNLSPEEEAQYSRIPEVGALLIAHIPRLERVARIVSQVSHHSRGNVSPSAKVADSMAFESIAAGILRATTDFEALVARGFSKSRALGELHKQKDMYDPKILSVLLNLEAIAVDRKMAVVRISDLNNTMVIRENVCARNGLRVVGESQQVTLAMRELLQTYRERDDIPETISVWVPAETARPQIEDIVPKKFGRTKPANIDSATLL